MLHVLIIHEAAQCDAWKRVFDNAPVVELR